MLQAIWRRVYLRDEYVHALPQGLQPMLTLSYHSWASLRAAVGLKDEELASTLCSTALFSTLAAASVASKSAVGPPKDIS